MGDRKRSLNKLGTFLRRKYRRLILFMDPLNLIREIILNLETAKNLVLKPLNREVLYLQCSCNILDSLKVELNREAFLI